MELRERALHRVGGGREAHPAARQQAEHDRQGLVGERGRAGAIAADSPSGHVQGMTLRLFDPQARQWSLYWANSAQGVLDRPMVGEFKDGRGEFYDQDRIDGRTVLVRFLWTDITES